MCQKKVHIPGTNEEYLSPPYTNKPWKWTTKNYKNAIDAISGVVGTYSVSAAASYFGFAAVVGAGTIGLPVTFLASAVAGNYLQNLLNNTFRRTAEINAEDLFNRTSSYISFFDYNYSYKEDDSNLSDFPLMTSGSAMRHYQDLTPFQKRVKYSQETRQLNTNESFFQIFGDISIDKKNPSSR